MAIPHNHKWLCILAIDVMKIMLPIFTKENWKKTTIEFIPLFISSVYFGMWLRGEGILSFILACGFFCFHCDLFCHFRKKHRRGE
jgi:hypothetical protein